MSGALTVLSDLLALFAGGFSLGGVSFTDLEVPTSCSFGGEQAIDVKVLPGGAKIIDVLGPSPVNPSWSGYCTGASALYRAQSIDAMRIAGQPVTLAFGGMQFQVVVRSFRADYSRQGTIIPYQIACESLSTVAAPDATGSTALAGLIGSDLAGSVSAVTGAIGQAGSLAASALSTVQGVVGRVTPLAGALGLGPQLARVTGYLNVGAGLVAGASAIGNAPQIAGQAIASVENAGTVLESSLGSIGTAITAIGSAAPAGGIVASATDMANAVTLSGMQANLASAAALAGRAAVNLGGVAP